jgi:hypothetical protein
MSRESRIGTTASRDARSVVQSERAEIRIRMPGVFKAIWRMRLTAHIVVERNVRRLRPEGSANARPIILVAKSLVERGAEGSGDKAGAHSVD